MVLLNEEAVHHSFDLCRSVLGHLNKQPVGCHSFRHARNGLPALDASGLIDGLGLPEKPILAQQDRTYHANRLFC